MLRTIVTLSITIIFSRSISGQLIDKSELIFGSWYSCGIMTLAINDTAIFHKNLATCKDNDCLYLSWIINKNNTFKFGWEKGCDDTKIGFGFKPNYQWSIELNNRIITIKKKKIIEKYKILQLNYNNLTVTRLN